MRNYKFILSLFLLLIMVELASAQSQPIEERTENSTNSYLTDFSNHISSQLTKEQIGESFKRSIFEVVLGDNGLAAEVTAINHPLQIDLENHLIRLIQSSSINFESIKTRSKKKKYVIVLFNEGKMNIDII